MTSESVYLCRHWVDLRESPHEPACSARATAVRDTVKRLISDVYAKLHPRTASGRAPLLNLAAVRHRENGFRTAHRETEEAAE